MLVYLSKKIAIPNDTHLATVSWHKVKGYIACGGENGLLKVLRMEIAPTKDNRLKGLAAPSNLSMNQTLEGHNGCVQVVAWNEQHHKLTSSDQNGLIIVWMLYKGMWHEEMINSRNKSVVRHMKWNPDGGRICIVYEDGAVIVGAVDGNRIWGKELRGLILTHVQWSPDSKILLFGNNNGEVHIYDSHGSYNSKMAIHCLSNVTGVVKLVGVEWYSGHSQIGPPCLAVVFDNGRAQLMKHELDDNPILLQTHMIVSCVQWNHNGSLLALGGMQKFQDGKDLCCVQFYTAYGQILHTLRVPGRNLCAVSWEGSGLRIALGVGPHIYFANIRHDYKWGHFSNTLVYSFRKKDKVEDSVIFWNLISDEKYIKVMNDLINIASCQDFCVLAVQAEPDPAKDDSDEYQCILLLCDALGTPVDSRYINMVPFCLCMSQTHLVAASETAFFVWHYRSSSHLTSDIAYVSTRRGREGQDRLIHVDDHPTGSSAASVDFSKVAITTSDPIACVSASNNMLLVGRISGVLQIYSLPKVSLESKHGLDCRPDSLYLNSNSTKISVIDCNGILSLYEILVNGKLERLPVERKEVWDFCWASDNPELFAIMEKTRLYIFRGTDPEEPVVSSGHICQFNDLEVLSAMLDEIMKDPENPTDELVLVLDIKSLRDARDLLSKVGLNDAHQFINDNPHPRLWRLLAESSLLKLELEMAEKSFIKCLNYRGIQFVKRLRKLDSEPKQRAEVEAYFKRFEEAERLYLDMDRRDLAVDLRVKLGDWFRVVQLVRTGGGAGDDLLLARAWNALGDYYADRHKLQHAVTYYSQGRNYEQLGECYYRLEDFTELEKLSKSLPPNSPALEGIAQKFMSVGMCEQAVDSFLRASMIEEAVDCCVSLNYWHLAVELARKHSMKQVDVLQAKYATFLLENEKILDVIELYRKANQFMEAAKLLHKVAKEAATRQLMSAIKIKKLYVLAAYLVERHLSNIRQKKTKHIGDSNKKGEVLSTLQELLDEEYSSTTDMGIVGNPWRGVEAYHHFMLAQKLFYSGKFGESLFVAVVLTEYEDVLPPVQIYSLLALTGSTCKAFRICSKAFTKLESLEDLPQEERELYEKLALEIFTKNPPKDTVQATAIKCSTCHTTVTDWVSRCTSCNGPFQLCIVSGKPLFGCQPWQCKTCKHYIMQQEVPTGAFKTCPFCHAHN